MANGVLFGAKEQFMMPLNEFLTANTPLVKGFLAELAVCLENKKRKSNRRGDKGREIVKKQN
jgi:hypothetical protein